MCALQVLLAALVCLNAVQISFCQSPAEKIVNYASSQLESHKWTSETIDRSAAFIDSLRRHFSMPFPMFIPGLGSFPATAAAWSDPSTHHTTACYKLCPGDPIPGDFLAENGHVAVVTGDHLTTGPALDATPQGTVKETDWGFRSGQNPTCWRYGGTDYCDNHLHVFG